MATANFYSFISLSLLKKEFLEHRYRSISHSPSPLTPHPSPLTLHLSLVSYIPTDLHQQCPLPRTIQLNKQHRIITALPEELNLKIKAYGSTTLDREDLEQGVEPDSCYYIQKAEPIKTRTLDQASDPPPDLAVEVDITSASRRCFTIYLQLGIPEVCQYTSGVAAMAAHSKLRWRMAY